MTETQHNARVAWLALVHPTPMPADIALDFVQDSCGDRDEAISAIITAAGDWLAAQAIPPATSTETHAGCREVALLAVSHLREQSSGLAKLYLGNLRQLIDRGQLSALAAERRSAIAWSVWLASGATAIAACESLVRAAYSATY